MSSTIFAASGANLDCLLCSIAMTATGIGAKSRATTERTSLLRRAIEAAARTAVDGKALLAMDAYQVAVLERAAVLDSDSSPSPWRRRACRRRSRISRRTLPVLHQRALQLRRHDIPRNMPPQWPHLQGREGCASACQEDAMRGLRIKCGWHAEADALAETFMDLRKANTTLFYDG